MATAQIFSIRSPSGLTAQRCGGSSDFSILRAAIRIEGRTNGFSASARSREISTASSTKAGGSGLPDIARHGLWKLADTVSLPDRDQGRAGQQELALGDFTHHLRRF